MLKEVKDRKWRRRESQKNIILNFELKTEKCEIIYLQTSRAKFKTYQLK